ncbi:hypothetical protein H0H87_007189 [Tephrocybe sp. NHM501043]|nr:hypothetical protein H0H87_007189 [Tephrocybe sp. NHM501043]
MVPSLPVLVASLISLLYIPTRAQSLNKETLENDLSYLDDPFYTYLPPVTNVTWDQWDAGWIPQACLNEANRDSKCSAASVEVIANMTEAFGCLPVLYRQWVRHPIVFTDTSRYAYAVNGEIVFFKDAYVPTIWIHESSHLMDAYAVFNNNGTTYSRKPQLWLPSK